MNSTGVTFVSSKQERKRFIDFVYNLNEDEKYFVPPLRLDQNKLINEKKNPFFNNAEIGMFIAHKDGKDVGRIAAIIDHRYNEYHGTKTGHFGFFDCVNDQHTANLLFRVASDWLKERGMEDMLGPANPSMMDTIGVLVEGFEKYPYILMPWNKPYYDSLIKKAGLTKAEDLLAYIVSTQTVDVERMNRALNIVKSRIPNLTLRPMDLSNVEREISIIHRIFNQAWKDNWGFIPLTKEEFMAMGNDIKLIVNTDYAHVAEIDGEPVAFSVGIPNLNMILKDMNGRLFPFGIFKLLWKKRNINQLRTALMGVLPEYQGKGIDALLHQKSIQNGLNEDHVVVSELSWILESNATMIHVAERMGGTLDKTYRMYSKEL